MKEDVKEKQQDEGATASSEAPAANDKEGLARQYIQFLGGDENIEHLTNCATRLRVQVKDPEAVASDADFRQLGAAGVVRNNRALQVIVGTSVQNLKENIDEVLT